ncbi:MAG: hypothetical protein J2P22_06050 [Nocardioides sp.]|nr:hypothetical protein [Nocardioides sp.]
MSQIRRARLHHRIPVFALVAAGSLVAALVSVSIGAPAQSETQPGNQETHPFAPQDQGPDIPAPKSHAPSRVPAKNVPQVNGLPVTAASGVNAQTDGLSMRDQRTSNNGNAFSLEPPDQGLCVGNGTVIEGINDIFATYNAATGARTSGVESYAPFFNNGALEVVRNPDGTISSFGPFMSDPKCYYDPELGRFYMTILQLGTDPATGAFNGDSFEDIAVSKTSTPTTDPNDWFLYKLNVRNDGTQGTPSHTGCPCLGDQPLIGADRYGFYLTTNEFPISGPGFNGAQIYAFDKQALANGTMKVQRIEDDGTPLAEGTAYSVQPATSPSADQWSNAANGTEFALSALEFTGGFDNRIATWALTNTQSLTTATPDVQVSKTVMGSEVYGFPPAAEQKAGPVPQAKALHAKENLLASNDDRMNQVVYAAGKLWSGLNSAVKTPNYHTTAGIAYFVVSPTASGSKVSATMSHQGYVAATGQSTIFPSIGVTPSGAGVMTFSLTGKRFFPTSAIVHLAPSGAVNSGIQILANGAAPADGFSGYPAQGGAGEERWGDYSAAVADSSGKVWVASEYIPGTYGFPQFIGNWGTYVASVTP